MSPGGGTRQQQQQPQHQQAVYTNGHFDKQTEPDSDEFDSDPGNVPVMTHSAADAQAIYYGGGQQNQHGERLRYDDVVGNGLVDEANGGDFIQDDEDSELEDPEDEDLEGEEMSAEDSYEETDSETGSSVISWVSWYCSLPGHEYFLEVPEDFIEDDFNLTGLSYGIPYYNEALDLILDIDQEEPANPACMSEIESSAEILYGSIHARYIITKPGLHGMLQKYLEGVFGTCPRVYCGALGALSLLPMGPSDVPGEDTIKMVCGRCGDLYFPKEAKYQSIDGAFFGTTFPHFLWLTYPDSLPPNVSRSENPLQFLRPKMELGRVDDDENDDEDYYGQDKRSSSSDEQESRGTGDDSDDPLTYRIYQPRIFGFRVNERSVVGPRMAWLRWKDVVDEDGPRT